MKAPLSWLKEYVDINVDIQTLCQKMVDIGLEIEEVNYLGSCIENIVVGQILEISKHPDADKLRCCKVDVGQSEPIPIVTNSQTVNVGDKVPVALHNAKTANGMHITKGKMRGEPSHGRFCGGEELGITKDFYANADIDGVLVLSANAVVGENIAKEVGLDDYILDVCVTSNRQDCNSIYGLAREVAVALNQTCRPLQIDFVETSQITGEYVDVHVEDADLCPSYYMQGVVEVKVAPSPRWMTQRLAKVGLHGINNFVDITNYVLMEVGQPMHAFDYSEIIDKTIIIRRAKNGETIIPLDGKTYKLTKETLVIADKNRAVGLAGIMGGQNSGIRNDTKAIMFEAARFDRGSVRRSSRRLGLRSDSSARFEKGIDAETTPTGLSRALHLVQKLNCGKILGGRISCLAETAEKKIIEFEVGKIKQLLGIEIPHQTITKILADLNIETKIENGKVKCIVPVFRDDISLPCDIIEEIIRIYGYDNIVGTLLEHSNITHGGVTEMQKQIDALKTVLCGLHFNECVFYPFGGKALFDKLSVTENADVSKNISLMNPLGDELSLMCTSMLPNMLQCASLNQNRKNLDFKLYEVGRVYLAEKLPLQNLPVEQKRITLCASGVDFDKFKEDILVLVKTMNSNIKLCRSTEQHLHTGISADILIDGKKIGSFGQVHPKVQQNFQLLKEVYVADINFDALFELREKAMRYKAIAKFPKVERDFALVVEEEVAVQDILDTIKETSALCEQVKLFDIYRSQSLGQNKKSIAVSVSFRDANKTLSELDIEKQIAKCLKALSDKFGAVLRN